MVRQIDLKPGHRWFIVGFGFLALALAFSARTTLGLLMPVWEAELGWSRRFVSATGAAALVVMAIIAPFAGRLVDRSGPRVALVVGLSTLAIGFLTISLTNSRIVFALAFGGVSAIGFGVMSTSIISAAIARNFTSQQGIATGVATSGATAGQFIVVPLIAAGIGYVSWRWSFAVIGLACVLLIPATWKLLARANNETRLSTDQRTGSLRTDVLMIVKKPAFQILFWSFLLCGYTTTGVIETHFLPYASFCGFNPVPSATAFGLLSATNMIGMIGAGWLSDKINRPLLLGGIYLVRGLTFILLMNVGPNIETLYLFATLFGLVDYATIPVTASLVASHLGLRVVGLAMGVLAAGHALGGAAGAFLGGYLFDIYTHYQSVWLSSLWLTVLAGAIVFFLRDKPRAPALVCTVS